jgi:hypothetical protein
MAKIVLATGEAAEGCHVLAAESSNAGGIYLGRNAIAVGSDMPC